jgi:hypothetical protein
MEKLTSDLQRPRDRMLASHSAGQLTVGQRLRVECQGLKELSHKKGSAAATVKIIPTRIALDVLRSVGAFSSFVETA